MRTIGSDSCCRSRSYWFFPESPDSSQWESIAAVAALPSAGLAKPLMYTPSAEGFLLLLTGLCQWLIRAFGTVSTGGFSVGHNTLQ
jgi:hypothetical protein